MNENKNNGLAVASMVLGIIALLASCFYGGVLGIVSLILGIVSVAMNRSGKGMAVAGIVTSSISILITAVVFLVGISSYDQYKKNDTKATTEATTTQEETTEESTTEASTEIDVEELKSTAEDVTYEDIYRNPETWRDKELKIVVHVDKYESKFFGTVGTYYCNVNGQPLLIVDVRKTEEPTIAAGDNVVVYGLGGGMATLTESDKNIIGITTDKQESKIPQINMYAAELQ